MQEKMTFLDPSACVCVFSVSLLLAHTCVPLLHDKKYSIILVWLTVLW